MKLKSTIVLPILYISTCITACGGGGSSTTTDNYSPPNPESGNMIPFVVKLPNGSSSILNVPYVSVKICAPNSNNCQIIDNIILDTGSAGLRIFANKISSSISLTSTNLGECALFGSGYDWGSIKLADVTFGGEKAPSVPIQIINDPALPIPENCSNTGHYNDLGGANGILGVNAIPLDVDGPYYNCSTPATCHYTSVSYTQKLISPSYKFAKNNNGIIISMPNVPNGGAKDLQGTLIFGIGTQSNNQPAANTATLYSDIYAPNASFSATYEQSARDSIFDTGSTEIFFNTNDPALPLCTGAYSEFYCPLDTYTLRTKLASYDGYNSINYNFEIINFYDYVTQHPASAAVPNSAAIGDDNWLIWGLPFFYGKTVYVGFARAISQTNITTPYFAFTN